MTKLSLGAYGAGGHVAAALDRVGARVALLADTALEMASAYQDQGVLVVGRVSLQQQAKDTDPRFRDFAQQPLGDDAVEAFNLGHAFAQQLVACYPAVQVWQLYNESVATGDWRGYLKLAAFELQATITLHNQGRQSCVLNLGVGVGQPEEYAQYFSGLLSIADFVGFHGYGGPEHQLMQFDPSWYALRYRRVADAMRAEGCRMPPVILTECTTYDPWHGRFSAEQIAFDLIWLGQEIAKDDYVVGACGFQIGHPNSQQWGGFDLSDGLILDVMGNWNANHAAGPWVDAVSRTVQEPEEEEGETVDAKLSMYADWAKARLVANEDPRDVSAFVAHLRALGAEWQKPHECGLPYVVVSPKVD